MDSRGSPRGDSAAGRHPTDRHPAPVRLPGCTLRQRIPRPADADPRTGRRRVARGGHPLPGAVDVLRGRHPRRRPETRRTRFDRIQQESRAATAQLVQIHDYVFPRIGELADVLPARLASGCCPRVGRADWSSASPVTARLSRPRRYAASCGSTPWPPCARGAAVRCASSENTARSANGSLSSPKWPPRTRRWRANWPNARASSRGTATPTPAALAISTRCLQCSHVQERKPSAALFSHARRPNYANELVPPTTTGIFLLADFASRR